MGPSDIDCDRAQTSKLEAEIQALDLQISRVNGDVLARHRRIDRVQHLRVHARVCQCARRRVGRYRPIGYRSQ